MVNRYSMPAFESTRGRIEEHAERIEVQLVPVIRVKPLDVHSAPLIEALGALRGRGELHLVRAQSTIGEAGGVIEGAAYVAAAPRSVDQQPYDGADAPFRRGSRNHADDFIAGDRGDEDVPAMLQPRGDAVRRPRFEVALHRPSRKHRKAGGYGLADECAQGFRFGGDRAPARD